jgi:hypothetical protein
MLGPCLSGSCAAPITMEIDPVQMHEGWVICLKWISPFYCQKEIMLFQSVLPNNDINSSLLNSFINNFKYLVSSISNIKNGNKISCPWGRGWQEGWRRLSTMPP